MKQFFLSSIAAALLSVLLFSGCAPASDLCRQADKKTILQKASPAENSEKTAAITLLDDKEETFVNSDGTYTVSDACIYRINNYNGMLMMRTIPLHFNSNYGTVSVTHLVLVKPDGRRLKLDPEKNSAITVDNSQMSAEIFDPDQKILSVRIPGLEVGDIIEITTLENVTKSRIPGEFSDIAVLQADFPIIRYEYIINMPADKPLRSIGIKDEVKGTLTFTETEKDGRIIYRWIAENVPMVIPENAMPPLYTCVQRVLTSTVKSWEDISRWYDNLCAPRLAAADDAVRQKTAELTAGKKTDMEKITALFQFVSQQIRYTGITDEDSAPGYEPHDVDKTFHQRHGVCRDKAALLAAMLKIAGFKAYPTLFMSGSPKDIEVPNIYFNHAIVAVEISPGKYILMDPTFETTTELFPGYLAGDPFLVAKPEGETLKTAPTTDAFSNLMEIKTAGKLTDNILTTETLINFSGVYDQMYRDAFSQWTKDDIDNFFAAGLKKILPGAELKKVSIQPADIRDMSQVLQLKLSWQMHGLLTADTGEQLLNVPRGAFVFGMLDSIFTASALKTRRFPLKALPRAVKESISLDLPENIHLILPEKYHSPDSKLLSVTYDNSFKNQRLNEEFTLAVLPMQIAPADYAAFKSAAAKARSIWQTFPVIRQSLPYSAEGANSELIEDLRHIYIHNGNSWDETSRIVRHIRNYAGVKEYANIRIPFTEGAGKPEISGSVTNSRGEKFTLSAKDINYMDSSGNAAQPRYLKRKIAVVSFPGVDAGSTVECTVKRQVTEQPFFYTDFVTMTGTPARKRELIIEHPAQMKLKISGIPYNVQDSATFGGRRIIRRYTVKNSPRIAEEPGQSPYRFFVPSLQISSGDNRKLFDDINSRAAAKAMAVTPEIKFLAEKIAAGAPDDFPAFFGEELLADRKTRRRIAAILAVEKYVYQHIRGTSLPLHQMSDQEYSLPETTLHDAYGNSADRAILMAAMLHALGIKFSFIPAVNLPAEDKILSCLNDFPQNCADTLLVKTEFDIILNDSGLYGPRGIVHSEGKIGQEDGTFIELCSWSGAKKEKILCSLILKDDLSAQITLDYSFGGSWLETEKERAARFTPALEKQYIERLAASISPQAEIETWQFNRDADNKGVFLSLKVNVPDFAKRTGKFISMPLPAYSALTKLAALPSKTRSTPYLASGYSQADIVYKIEFPAGFKPAGNESFSSLTAAGGMTHYVDKHTMENRIILNSGIQIYPAMVSPDQFGSMLDINRRINHIDSKNILFTTE